MTTSIPPSYARDPWVDAQRAPADVKAMEVGFATMSITSPQSVKGSEDTRPPALSISSISTAGDGSVSSSSLKHYQNPPGTPPPPNNAHHTCIDGSMHGNAPQSLLQGGTQTLGSGGFNRSASEPLGAASFPSPIGRGPYRISSNDQGKVIGEGNGAERPLSSSLESSELFLRSNGSEHGSDLRQSLSFLVGGEGSGNESSGDHRVGTQHNVNEEKITNLDVVTKDGGRRCDDQHALLVEGISGLHLSPGSNNRSVPSVNRMATPGSASGDPSPAKSDGAKGKNGLCYTGSFGDDYGNRSIGRNSLDSPSHRTSSASFHRSRAFSSPGPIESSRIGYIGAATSGNLGPTSPSASSLSSAWDEHVNVGRSKRDPLTSNACGSNFHFRNFTAGQIPELSSTEDDGGFGSTGLLGDLRTGSESGVGDTIDTMKPTGNVSDHNMWRTTQHNDLIDHKGSNDGRTGIGVNNDHALPRDDRHLHHGSNGPPYDDKTFAGSPKRSNGGVMEDFENSNLGGGSGVVGRPSNYNPNAGEIGRQAQSGSLNYEPNMARDVTNFPSRSDSVDDSLSRGRSGYLSSGSSHHPQLRHTLSDVSSNRNHTSVGPPGMMSGNHPAGVPMMNGNLVQLPQQQHGSMPAGMRGRSFTDGNFNEQQFLYHSQQRQGGTHGVAGSIQSGPPDGPGFNGPGYGNSLSGFVESGSVRGDAGYVGGNCNAGAGQIGTLQSAQHPNQPGNESHMNMQQIHFQSQQQLHMQMQLLGPQNQFQMQQRQHQQQQQGQQQQQQLHPQSQQMGSLTQQQNLYGQPSIMAPNRSNSDFIQHLDEQQRQQLLLQERMTSLPQQENAGIQQQQQQQRQIYIQNNPDCIAGQGHPSRVIIPGMDTVIMSSSTGPGGENYGHIPRSGPGPNMLESQQSLSSSSLDMNSQGVIPINMPPHQQRVRAASDSFTGQGAQSSVRQMGVYQTHQGLQTIHPQDMSGRVVSSDVMISTGGANMHSMQGRMTPSRGMGGQVSQVQQNAIVSSPSHGGKLNVGMHGQIMDGAANLQTSSVGCKPPPNVVDAMGLKHSSFDNIENVENNVSAGNMPSMVHRENEVGHNTIQQSALIHSRTVASNASLSSSSSMEQMGSMLPHYGTPPELPTAGASAANSSGPRLVYNVKFKRTQRSFILGPRAPRDVKVGCYVKVEADRGEDLGIVISRVPSEKFNIASRSNYRLSGSGTEPGGGGAADLKKIIRLATHDEISLLVDKREEEEMLLKVCRTKVKQRGLTMNVVDAEYQYDRHKLIFFFEAEGRIDFRELVRDLFSMYKTRIWMQQLDKGGSSSSSSGSLCGGNLASVSSDTTEATPTD